MRLIRVAAAVLNQTPMDWARNKANILGAIRDARKARAPLLCLPELCICGYGCEDEFFSPGLRDTCWSVLQEILPETRGMIVSLGLPVMFRNALYNSVCLAVDGHIAGFVAKRFLAGEGIHYEPRWFKPWPQGTRVDAPMPDGKLYPFGDIHFDCGGVKIGFEICEDAWVATRPGGAMALKAVDIILNPSASHFAFGKSEIRRRFVLEGSRAFAVTYIYSNLLGNEAGRAIYDGGALIASAGNMLASGQRFSFADWQVTCATADLSLTRTSQSRNVSFRPDLEDAENDCVRLPFAIPRAKGVPHDEPTPEAWDGGDSLKFEEFARAVSLALMDYLRKTRSSGFVVSLSGGVDSATCACLVMLGVRLGVAELGLERFLTHVAGSAKAHPQSIRDVIHGFLLTVYQGTENSSETTRHAAEEVAKALGAEHLEFSIDELVKKYVAMIGGAVGRPLTWQRDDLALQNIQARVRAPGVWLLANLRNALLLSTSNRSEAAVGYATMDGDTCGGLSPIAGIDKNFLRQWLCWMETDGPVGIGPVRALELVNSQAPTAELRPPTKHQTDEEDLMPYDVLDAIERAAIRDKRSPVEVYDVVRWMFPRHTPADLARWVERFFRLWCRNQWKRERYAPSFHLDDENLDPKTWCRFPILCGGFVRELEELKRHVAAEKKPKGRKS